MLIGLTKSFYPLIDPLSESEIHFLLPDEHLDQDL